MDSNSLPQISRNPTAIWRPAQIKCGYDHFLAGSMPSRPRALTVTGAIGERWLAHGKDLAQARGSSCRSTSSPSHGLSYSRHRRMISNDSKQSEQSVIAALGLRFSINDCFGFPSSVAVPALDDGCFAVQRRTLPASLDDLIGGCPFTTLGTPTSLPVR
jgi:hypothetical protein